MALRRLRGWAAAWCALLVLFAVAGPGGGAVSASQVDARYGVYVQDEAGMISWQTEESLYAQAVWLYEQTGSAQIGVVTVNDLGGSTLEAYAVAKFRELGLGSRERNDGVLLLYAKEENRVRIEIGYGMEGRIPDGKAGAILDQYFVPNRDAGRFDDAFFQTQSALIIEMAAEYGIDASSAVGSGSLPAPDYAADEGEGFWSSLPWPVKVIGGAVIVLLLILDFKFTGGAVTYAIFHMLSRGRGGSSGGGWGGGRGGGGSSGGGGASR